MKQNFHKSKREGQLRKIYSFILVLIFFFMRSTVMAQEAWLVDPLESIYPDQNNVRQFSESWKADFPGNTLAGVHILAEVPAGNTLGFTAIVNGRTGKGTFYHLLDVPVEQNTGLDSRTEQFTSQRNPYVVRRAPFRIFEVMKPLPENSVYTTVTYTALRFEVPSNQLQPGKNEILIRLEIDGWSKELAFYPEVHQVEVPGLEESSFFYTNWFNLARMEEAHEVDRWTDEWYTVLDGYATMMARGRQNSITLPGEFLYVKDGTIRLNEDEMLRFVDVFRKRGFKYFESPHLMNRGEGDDWSDPELKVALTSRRYYRENGKQDIDEIVQLFADFATRNQLTQGWLQHISDEPTVVQARCYSDVADQVRSIFPGVRIMEATNDRDSIVGAVDIWCPLINDFQENEDFFRQREQEGESVLVYTCLIPGGKWLNRTLDMEHLRQVYFGWGAAHYGTSGYLHWGLNQYKADPYLKSAIPHPSPVATPNNYLPAGDTHILYPGVNRPRSSVRFEAHRIGIEDYELLSLVEDPTKYTRKLFNSYTDYTTSIRKYRKIRRKLLLSLDD